MKVFLESAKIALFTILFFISLSIYSQPHTDNRIKPRTDNSINVRIIGEIYIPPCKVNNDSPINISFGKIPLRKVDGSNFAEERTVPISCDYFRGDAYVRFDGTNALSQPNILKTTGVNSSNFGIALYQGSGISVPMNIGKGSGINSEYGNLVTNGLSATSGSGQFTFTAVPIKYGSSDLVEGFFTATGILSITYV
ncbi:fimbrial protein [Photobacterium damselae]|uniref:Fimbrial protein n=1 Tax=Photobacterium damselae TaxID=38293 RepID=A0ABD6X032_PHODM|nr:fimbrial protein [Photobacterium damselae]EJN6961740.1 fimbrial protein [Photobacterium damselae]PSU15432.1 fimbrial protein [Photobacterium damselae]